MSLIFTSETAEFRARSPATPVLFLVLLVLTFVPTMTALPDNHWMEDWQAWKKQRSKAVTGEEGWISLVGLHWLREGVTTLGEGSGHDVNLGSSSPTALGRIRRTGAAVVLEVSSGVVATVEGRPVHSITLVPDQPGPPNVVKVGTLSLSLIERGGRFGLRVRDSVAPARRKFAGLEYFPPNPAWRLTARFERYPVPKKLRIEDVTGSIEEMPVTGALVFTWDGNEYRLEAIEEPGDDELFVLFRDGTSGKSTYGAGRFLVTALPDAAGRVVVDFNRAYNPPCAFTEFATCPLPPRQNWLKIPVEAGELAPPGH